MLIEIPSNIECFRQILIILIFCFKGIDKRAKYVYNTIYNYINYMRC